jgi:outer membrane lipoprotein-sorting protein
MMSFILQSARVVTAATVLAATLPVLPAGADAMNKPTPALTAFQSAWSKVDNYSETIVAHETTNDGKSSQDRTYSYKFVKPTAALIEITDGPGKGGGAAWHGGDRVKGHQGGFLSHVKLIISIDDPRATSLRGDTIEVASFGYELDHFLGTAGTLTEAAGSGGTVVTLTPSSPEKSGVTKETLTIDSATHLPTERDQYVGATIVKSEKFSDVKLNPGLTVKDIDIV